MALGLGRIADRLHVALVEVFEAGELDARQVPGAARLEIVGDLDDGRHRLADLAEEFEADRARHRRHLVQHPARGDDDAVGAFLLHAGNAAEELVGDVLAQPGLAAGRTGHGQHFLAKQALAAGVEALEAEFDLLLLVDLAVVVIDPFNLKPVAVRVDHLPPGQVVERGAPQHRLLAAGVHRDVAADAGGRGRGRVNGEDATCQRCGFRDALGDHAGAGTDRRVGRCVAGQDDFLDRADVDQLLGVDHRRVGRQRHGAAGVAGAAATRDDGQPGFDAAAHEVADFLLGVRVEDDEGVFDAPVGGVGDVRDAGEAVEGDVVLARVLAENAQDIAAQVIGFGKTGGEAVNRSMRGFDQALDLGSALNILIFTFGAALFDLGQAVPQGIDQCVAAFLVVEQVVFQIRVALNHPDVAQHLVEHARRAAGNAFAAQFVEHRPVVCAKQADDYLAIGKRGVVVGDFAQAGSHGCGRVPSKRRF